MSTQNLIRTVVILGIVAWPSVESYRLWQTTQKMIEAQALERSVSAKLDSVRSRHAQVAKAEPDPSTNPKP